MDWDDLRYLLAVHRRGSLGAAARELGVTKATASRRLAALEEAIGARLVERKPGGLALTAAGRAAVEEAEGMDARVSALVARVARAGHGEVRGTVRLTAPPWLSARCIIPALPELKSRYPGVEVQILGTDQVLNLAQREADLALRNVRPAQRSLVARRIGRLGGGVYASALYLEHRGVPASPGSLAGHDVLAYEGLSGMPGFEWLREPERGGRVVLRANGPEALVSAASAGLGLCAVPCLLGDASPALRRVDGLGYSTCDMFLVCHEDARALPHLRAVSELVVAVFERERAAILGERPAVAAPAGR